MRQLAVLAVLSVTPLFAQAPLLRESVPLAISLAPEKWKTIQGPMFTLLRQDGNGDLAFRFPASDGMHYLYTPHTSSIAGYSYLMAMVEAKALSGTPIYQYQTEPGNTCVYPAHVRLFIERQNDKGGEFYRWWSNPIAYELDTGGIATLAVPLTPDQWSSVFGAFGNSSAAASKGFHDALLHAGNLGMTFGGGCFFGHGVYVIGGTASFTVLSYELH